MSGWMNLRSILTKLVCWSLWDNSMIPSFWSLDSEFFAVRLVAIHQTSCWLRCHNRGQLFHQSRPGLAPNPKCTCGSGEPRQDWNPSERPNESSSLPLDQQPIDHVPRSWILQFLSVYMPPGWQPICASFAYVRYPGLLISMCSSLTLLYHHIKQNLFSHGRLELAHLPHFASKVVEGGSNLGDVPFIHSATGW